LARSGVSEEQVARAADELVLAGERPTIERVRAHLGTGSPNTLIRHLDAWWKRLGERLTESRRQVEVPDAPAEVSEAASAMWRLALMRAADVAAAGLTQDREALAQERLSLQELKLATEQTSIAARNAAAAAGVEADKARLRAEGLEQLCAQQREMIDRLERELARARAEVDRLRSQHQETAIQLKETQDKARADRESAAEHIKSVENRSHLEVDRARTEAAKSAKRIAELEKLASQLQANSSKRADGLLRDLRKAEAEAATLKIKLASFGTTNPPRVARNPKPKRLSV
jgi:chromosome segregation ATPase